MTRTKSQFKVNQRRGQSEANEFGEDNCCRLHPCCLSFHRLAVISMSDYASSLTPSATLSPTPRLRVRVDYTGVESCTYWTADSIFVTRLFGHLAPFVRNILHGRQTAEEGAHCRSQNGCIFDRINRARVGWFRDVYFQRPTRHTPRADQ